MQALHHRAALAASHGAAVDLARRHEPDIVALQEVDSRGRDPTNLPLEALKLALGGHAAEARTIVAEDGHYGHVLISRWPLEQIALHDVSIARREPRCAIDAVIRSPRGGFRVIATHLGLGLGERRRQIARLVMLTLAGGATQAVGVPEDELSNPALRPAGPAAPAAR